MKDGVDFDEVLLSLGKEVVSVLMRRGGIQEDAEDAVSKTFETIFSSILAMNADNLRPWFFRVSFNHYIDILRKKKREVTFLSSDVEIEAVGSTNPQQFWIMVDSLKQNEREMLMLKYYYRLSYEDIAHILDSNVEGVRKTLYRARKKLKESWEK